MKKNYFLAIVGVLAMGSASAQYKATDSKDLPIAQRHRMRIDAVQTENHTINRGGGPIWQDDFSDPNTWVLAHDENDCSLDWEVGTNLGCGGFYPIDTILSTTKANGYAMVDSDEYGGENGGNEIEDSWLTTADSIDLSNYDNVVLQFETWYRRYNYERPYVVISTDGVTWPDLNPDTDISGLPNVFEVFPGLGDVTSVDNNPVTIRLNISEVAGGQPKVWIRFHWTGTWGYAWFVDDVKLVEQPANDLVADYGFISHNGTGDEYGRIPQSQLLPSFGVGGEFYNFGYEDQNNVTATFEVLTGGSSVMSASSNYTIALSDSTYVMDETATPSNPLELGLYECSFSVASDEEQTGSATFENNTKLRSFEVTEDRYSLDGIGVHTENENLTSIGTASFADAADGFRLMTYYDISQTVAVMGLEIVLSSNSVPGGSMICSVHDTIDVLANDVTNALIEADIYDITQADIDAGVIQVLFEEPFVAEPNGYYACVEMFSNGNENDFRIVDDLTVPQPALSTVIYTPDDETVYTNGNAAAIRLITADNVGINDFQQLDGVSFYPNPVNDVLSLRISNSGEYTVEIHDAAGKLVLTDVITTSTDINVQELQSGFYTLTVRSVEGQFVDRLIVK